MKYLTALLFICWAALFLAGELCYAEHEVVAGNSEQEILAAMGKPIGRAVSGNVVIRKNRGSSLYLTTSKIK